MAWPPSSGHHSAQGLPIFYMNIHGLLLLGNRLTQAHKETIVENRALRCQPFAAALRRLTVQEFTGCALKM